MIFHFIRQHFPEKVVILSNREQSIDGLRLQFPPRTLEGAEGRWKSDLFQIFLYLTAFLSPKLIKKNTVPFKTS